MSETDSTPASKAEWGHLVLAAVTVLGVLFGVYGKYSADQATQEARIEVIEKEFLVVTKEISLMEDELDVLWVDARSNADSIKVIRKDQERFDTAFLKFAEATERLSVAVARIEEHMRVDELQKGLNNKRKIVLERE